LCGLEKFNLLFYGLQKCFLFRFHFKWLIIQHYFVCFALIVSLLSPKKNQVIFQLGYDFNLTLPLLLWSQDPHQSLPYNSSTKSSSAINHLSQVIKFLCACFLTLNLHFYDEEEMESNLFNLITQDVSIIISQILGVLFIYGLLSQVNQIFVSLVCVIVVCITKILLYVHYLSYYKSKYLVNYVVIYFLVWYHGNYSLKLSSGTSRYPHKLKSFGSARE